MKSGMISGQSKSFSGTRSQPYNDLHLCVQPTNPICGDLVAGYPAGQYMDTPPGFAAYPNEWSLDKG